MKSWWHLHWKAAERKERRLGSPGSAVFTVFFTEGFTGERYFKRELREQKDHQRK